MDSFNKQVLEKLNEIIIILKKIQEDYRSSINVDLSEIPEPDRSKLLEEIGPGGGGGTITKKI